MEQNAAAAMPVMDSGNQKGGNGLKIATAIASVVAVCGIGFGIYGMIQSSQKDSQISDLKVQVEDSNGKITTLETEKIETTDKDGTTVTIADSAVKNENSEDYIYVGEWGFKIKKPENWRDLVQRYVYYNDYPHAVDTFEIMENESVTTSHAMISPGNGNCKDDEWTDCIEIKLENGASTLDVRVPKASSGSVSEEFRSWITNSGNYSEI